MPAETAQPPSLLVPSIGLVIGGALWGLIWWPLRALGDFGLEGGWPSAAMFAGTIALLLPVMLWRWRRLAADWQSLVLSGACLGAAFSFYAISIALTEVVRAVLLFYLTPIWGTLLGLVFLGERLTTLRVVALAGGIAGLMAVLGGDGLPLPRNAGDWLALLSGVAWAFGSFAVYRMKTLEIPEQMTAFILGSLCVSTLAILFGGTIFGGATVPTALVEALPWAVLAGFYVVPVLFLTIWPTQLLTPGRVGLLLMTDVAVGVASAALLTDEPFGWREAIGTLLIIGAGAIAVLERPGH
ncbi:MAG: DMT family transporter [Pseudomonadota bacterium]